MDPPGRTDAAHQGRIFPEDCGKRRVVWGATQTHGAHFYILEPFFFFISDLVLILDHFAFWNLQKHI